jgi:NADH-quinone oxidoreductase subunit L
MTFWGAERFPEEAGHHPHDAPPVMKWPLVILALFAVGIGAAVGPTALFGDYLERTPGLHGGEEHGHSLAPMLWGTLAAVVGIGLAAVSYVASPGLPGRLAGALRAAYAWSFNKFYFDEIYVALVVRPLELLAAFCRLVDDYVVDALVDFLGRLPAVAGRMLRPFQNGLVQFYSMVMLVGFAVFVLAVLSLRAS